MQAAIRNQKKLTPPTICYCFGRICDAYGSQNCVVNWYFMSLFLTFLIGIFMRFILLLLANSIFSHTRAKLFAAMVNGRHHTCGARRYKQISSITIVNRILLRSHSCAVFWINTARIITVATLRRFVSVPYELLSRVQRICCECSRIVKYFFVFFANSIGCRLYWTFCFVFASFCCCCENVKQKCPSPQN